MANIENSYELFTIEVDHPIETEQDSDTISDVFGSMNIDMNADNLAESNMASGMRENIHWTKRLSPTTIFASVSFIIIVMIIGILTVCLTAPKPNILCQTSFKIVINVDSFKQNSNPRALATGDFNHDNFLDIAVVNSGTNSIGIFLNYGNGSFAPQMTFETHDYSTPMSVVLGDFNNDTCLDIVVANYESNCIGIFLGYGNGTFADQTTFSTGASRPMSMAVGDLNNDHWLDIVITNNGTNNIIILLGYGNGSFGNQTRYSTGYDSLPYSVVLNDFNNDHHLDIAVANYGTNNVGIFLGYGNGSFTTQIIYSTSLRSNPYSITANDFNNDGQLDIAVANSGTNNVGIFLGYGNGSFTSKKTYSVSPGSRPDSIAIGDINRDGKLDIVVSNYETNNISILIGYGNGSFATPIMHSTGTGSSPSGVIIGDFDNDNQFDIAVVNFDMNNLLLLIEYEMVESQNPTTYSTGIGSSPYNIMIGDFDNDTNIDLAVVNFGTNNVGVLLGYGNGSFQEQVTYSSGNNSYPYGLAIGDLDNDHQLDIVVGNSNTQSLGILYGYGNGTFATLVPYFTGDSSSIRAVIVNDFNNDNHLDIAFADFGTNEIGVFLGYGNRIFGNLTKYASQNNSRPCSLAAGDFNSDGHLDIAVADYGTNEVAIFLGSNNGTFILFSLFLTGDGSLPQMLTIGDLNNDNYLDIIVANIGTSNAGVFFGFGNGTFSIQMAYSTGSSSSPVWVSVADLNNDGCLDLAMANRNINNVGVLLGDSLGYFGNQTTYSTGSNSRPYAIAVGDFNKDNRLDIAVANYGTNNIAILLGHPTEDSINQTVNATAVDDSNQKNQSNSTLTNQIINDVPILLGDYYPSFRSQIPYSTGSSSDPYSLAIGDLNNDTEMDLIVANSGNENIGIFLGSGTGNFATETIYPTGVGSDPKNIIVDDFNNDNHLDAAVTNSENDSIMVLLGNGNGTFSTELTYSTDSLSNPSALASGHLNNDEYLDLVVANEGTDTISIFFGYDYTSFEKQSPYNCGATSQPTAIAIADFNNDGQLDIVSAFYGTDDVGVFLGYGNGTFTSMVTYGDVPSSHPWSVAVGDFNNDNQTDITVAAWGVDSISIILGYGNGSFAKPIVYPISFGARPVSVAVGDFNNDHYLDITTANYGGNSVGVFIGYGNGTFQNVTIYSTGKHSYPGSVTVSDINNDNRLDIIVANGGLNNVGIFLGYGNGSFADQLISSTGDNSFPWFAIAGDFNKDGRLDLAVANYGTSNLGILYGYGNGTFQDLQTYTTGTESKPTIVRAGYFNNDKLLDLIISDEISNNIGIFFGYSDGTFANMSTVPLQLGSVIYDIGLGDFNNDNHLDFVLPDYGNNIINVFFASGTKPFGGQTLFSVGEGSHPSALVVGHFNNDTLLDIAVANSGTNNMGILLGHGNRKFSNMTTFSTGNGSQLMSLAIGDLNNDSLTDIVVANWNSNNIIIYIGYGNGNFSKFMTYSMSSDSQPISIAIGYFNRDYQLDIAVANFGTNNVCVFFGGGNGTFTNQTYYSFGYDSRPNWIGFKDLNKDGWEDTAVVNYGFDDIEILLNLC